MKIALGIVLAFVLLLFAYSYFYLIPDQTTHEWIVSKENVRGASIQHRGYVYTLNFDQQLQLIESLNNSKKDKCVVKALPEPNAKNAIEQIVLYLFDSTEIVLIPEGNAQIYKLFVSRKDNYFCLQLSNPNRFNDFINKTYDLR